MSGSACAGGFEEGEERKGNRMDGCEFFDCVSAHSELEVIGIREGKLLVKHEPTRAVYGIRPEAVVEEEWETLEEILCGKRNPIILSHMTRIVGYYSQIENWNKSKLGELSDRRKGNYAVAAG